MVRLEEIREDVNTLDVVSARIKEYLLEQELEGNGMTELQFDFSDILEKLNDIVTQVQEEQGWV